MSEEVVNWYKNKRLETVKTNLEKKKYKVLIIEDKKDIEKYINDNIQKNETIGLGGSTTTRQLGVDQILKKNGNIIYDHWPKNISFEKKMDIARQQVSSDCFISSANAITLAGQLVNIDYLGNRVASMVCGPKRVVLFIGINKIVDTVESALARVKNVACPMDSKRTNKGTSCEKIGYCVNCNTENSICTITTIIERKPLTIDYTIILLPFEIGF